MNRMFCSSVDEDITPLDGRTCLKYNFVNAHISFIFVDADTQIKVCRMREKGTWPIYKCTHKYKTLLVMYIIRSEVRKKEAMFRDFKPELNLHNISRVI